MTPEKREENAVTVTSKENPLVKEWRALCRESKRRRESGFFAIEGARLCSDALLSGRKPRTLLVTAAARRAYAETAARLEAAAEQTVEISPELASYMADTASPQGIFCITKCLDNPLSLDTINTAGRYCFLEDMQDPGNLGTVIRTAEALGLDGLLLSAGCCDVYNPKVLRASMGGVFRLPLCLALEAPRAVEQLQKKGLRGFACVVDADAEPVQLASFGAGAFCLIGNEGNGLRPETVAACARRVTIPMAGRAESLNASLAAGLVMWEMVR